MHQIHKMMNNLLHFNKISLYHKNQNKAIKYNS